MSSASKTAAFPLYGLLFAVISCWLASPAFAQSEKTVPAPPRSSVEQDLLRRLRSEPVSQGTLDSLNMPADFLERVADRIIRMDYQKRFRGVARDPGTDQTGALATSGNGANAGTTSPSPTTGPANRTVIGVGAFGGLAVLIAVLARRRRQGKRP